MSTEPGGQTRDVARTVADAGEGAAMRRTHESMFAPSPLHPQTPLQASEEPYAPEVLERLTQDAAEVTRRLAREEGSQMLAAFPGGRGAG